MLPENIISQFRNDAQGLAEYFSKEYFLRHSKRFPLNSFQILTDLGIHFVFRKLDKVEGLFMPSMSADDVNLVAINSQRPITRQRFTAAHELCHFLKDSTLAGNYICVDGAKNVIERYADAFASALLMPKDELKKQIDLRGKDGVPLSYDDILIIADYFGTSLEACYWRIHNLYWYLTPDPKDKKKYKPNKRREELGLSHLPLLSDMIDAWTDIYNRNATDFAMQVFKNHYIYNDARLEGVNASQTATAEIVTDLQNKTQNSSYCNVKYEPFCHIAGHAKLYDRVFSNYSQHGFTIYEILTLNRLLFSTFPYPDAGGEFRQTPAIITDSSVETIDWHEIPSAMGELYKEVGYIEKNIGILSRSQIIKALVQIHYKLTVIHPFNDGNGRTSRGFLNEALLRYGMPPVYITVDKKDEYRADLAKVDHNKDYTKLYEFFMLALINSHVEFSI